ncbi:hypothetical protein [Thermogutta sp.]|uniref:hypothetical protein n=1 Tax=Thermogutta sp. TaxID=1962930 RepID=UPI0032201350
MIRCNTALSRSQGIIAELGGSLTVEEQLQLLEALDERHDEVLRMIDDLESRVLSVLETWARKSTAGYPREGQKEGPRRSPISVPHALTRGAKREA